VRTLPAGAIGTRPHHINYEMPADGMLWANGFDSGQTFRFDVRDPASPRLIGTFGAAPPFSHPHSYARLANGHVLATFQHRIDRGQAEIDFSREQWPHGAPGRAIPRGAVFSRTGADAGQ
jgi:hypothetical protein